MLEIQEGVTRAAYNILYEFLFILYLKGGRFISISETFLSRFSVSFWILESDGKLGKPRKKRNLQLKSGVLLSEFFLDHLFPIRNLNVQ